MKHFLRVTTALLFLAGIIWLIVDPGFDALIAFLTGILTLIGSFVTDKKGEAETVDQRNRRIMLGHVENFWVKGILEKSLHGAALLDLGIKEDTGALNYPWTIKREANKDILPAGTSMLEVFHEIGMGRSLLILGAPGSGKTTMLLELTRQLIDRAREDVTEPIPVVFNLSSWTEKLTLADWLARELNVIYTIPKKTAPTWIKENKMLLLLDGLDEVRQESRDQCVDAINQFRKENGLTSMAVCSRIQDYAELETRLSFDGAIEIQPLASKQVSNYFKRFGNELAGIRQILEKDTLLREMAETPLFLSIMTLAYRDTERKNILVSENLDIQRKHLFDTYISRMFERPERSKNYKFKKLDVLLWLSWLAQKMINYNQAPYLVENMQPKWLDQKNQMTYRMVSGLVVGSIFGLVVALIFGLVGISLVPWWDLRAKFIIEGLREGLIFGLIVGLFFWIREIDIIDTLIWEWKKGGKGLIIGLALGVIFGLIGWTIGGLSFGLSSGLIFGLIIGLGGQLSKIEMVDYLTWNWKQGIIGLSFGLGGGVIVGLILGLKEKVDINLGSGVVGSLQFGLAGGLFTGSVAGLIFGLILGLIAGLNARLISQTSFPGQRVYFSARNFSIVFLASGLISVLVLRLSSIFTGNFIVSVITYLTLHLGLITGLIGGLWLGGFAVIQHYTLRLVLTRSAFLPWKLISLLNHCVDLIFLRRVGGGYIFVHRSLMEHFATMYVEKG